MDLEVLRSRIDRVDEDLIRLLNQRADAALAIGREKKERGAPVVDPARENAVLKRARTLNKGPLSDGDLEAIYRAIVEACARIQSEL